jgi:hypothetical protein
MADDIFDEQNEVKPQSINWGKIGDNVAGIKIGQRDSKTKFGMNTVYEIKVEGGFFHDQNGEKVTLVAGDTWSVWGRNDIFDSAMNRLQIGQKFGLKFTESKPSTMGNDAKIIKIFTTGAMDQAYLDSQSGADKYQSQ